MNGARTSADRLKALTVCSDPERLRAALMGRLGASRFGNEVLVVVDLAL
jgi:hypothetical protein